METLLEQNKALLEQNKVLLEQNKQILTEIEKTVSVERAPSANSEGQTHVHASHPRPQPIFAPQVKKKPNKAPPRVYVHPPPLERVGATAGDEELVLRSIPRGIPRINECGGSCKGREYDLPTCTCAEEETKRYAEAKTCKTCGLPDFICYRSNYGRCG